MSKQPTNNFITVIPDAPWLLADIKKRCLNPIWFVIFYRSSIPGLFSLQRMPPPLLFQAIFRVRVRAIVLLFLGLGLGLGSGLGLKC